MTASLCLRPVSREDQPFLFQLFAETRSDIQGATHLSEDMRSQLLQSQFDAQTSHYRTHFPNADFGIIEFENKPVGRLYLNRTPVEILIVDLALLSKHRSRGLGTALLTAIQNEARLTGRSVRLHVEKSNPAISFYQRHGFRQVGNKPMHFELQWSDTQNREQLASD